MHQTDRQIQDKAPSLGVLHAPNRQTDTGQGPLPWRWAGAGQRFLSAVDGYIDKGVGVWRKGVKFVTRQNGQPQI